MKRYTIIIDTFSPLHTGSVRKGNVFESADYIPGSTIRGALAWLCIDNGVKPENPSFAEVFTHKNTLFYNALISARETDDSVHRFKPVFASMYTCSTVPGSKYENPSKHGIVNLLDKSAILCAKTGCAAKLEPLKGYFLQKNPEIRLKNFPDSGDILLTSPSKTAYTMNRIDYETQTTGQDSLYTVVCLDNNQVFSGNILASDSFEDMLQQAGIELGKTFKLFLGKCISKGYGETRVKIIPNPDCPAPRTPEKGLLTIGLVSNALFTNTELQSAPGPSADYLAAELGIDAHKITRIEDKCFYDWDIASSWLSLVGLPEGKVHILRQGSIFTYLIDNNLSDDALIRLSEKGIGLRRHLGYGEIICNPVIPV